MAEAVRDAVGPDVKIMVDVHTFYTVSPAIALGRKLEAIDAAWLESPLVPEDIGGLAELSRALDVPVASSEWTRTRWDLREAFERRAFDIVMPDIARTGLTEGMAIATLADTYNIPVAPHVGGGGHRVDRRLDPLLRRNTQLPHHGATTATPTPCADA